MWGRPTTGPAWTLSDAAPPAATGIEEAAPPTADALGQAPAPPQTPAPVGRARTLELLLAGVLCSVVLISGASLFHRVQDAARAQQMTDAAETTIGWVLSSQKGMGTTTTDSEVQDHGALPPGFDTAATPVSVTVESDGMPTAGAWAVKLAITASTDGDTPDGWARGARQLSAELTMDAQGVPTSLVTANPMLPDGTTAQVADVRLVEPNDPTVGGAAKPFVEVTVMERTTDAMRTAPLVPPPPRQRAR